MNAIRRRTRLLLDWLRSAVSAPATEPCPFAALRLERRILLSAVSLTDDCGAHDDYATTSHLLFPVARTLDGRLALSPIQVIPSNTADVLSTDRLSFVGANDLTASWQSPPLLARDWRPHPVVAYASPVVLAAPPCWGSLTHPMPSVALTPAYHPASPADAGLVQAPEPSGHSTPLAGRSRILLYESADSNWGPSHPDALDAPPDGTGLAPPQAPPDPQPAILPPPDTTAPAPAAPLLGPTVDPLHPADDQAADVGSAPAVSQGPVVLPPPPLVPLDRPTEKPPVKQPEERLPRQTLDSTPSDAAPPSDSPPTPNHPETAAPHGDDAAAPEPPKLTPDPSPVVRQAISSADRLSSQPSDLFAHVSPPETTHHDGVSPPTLDAGQALLAPRTPMQFGTSDFPTWEDDPTFALGAHATPTTPDPSVTPPLDPSEPSTADPAELVAPAIPTDSPGVVAATDRPPTPSLDRPPAPWSHDRPPAPGASANRPPEAAITAPTDAGSSAPSASDRPPAPPAPPLLSESAGPGTGATGGEPHETPADLTLGSPSHTSPMADPAAPDEPSDLAANAFHLALMEMRRDIVQSQPTSWIEPAGLLAGAVATGAFATWYLRSLDQHADDAPLWREFDVERAFARWRTHLGSEDASSTQQHRTTS